MVRHKEIQYSSRTRANTDQFKTIQSVRCALANVLGKLPPELMDSEDGKILQAVADHRVYKIVHLIYRSKNYEGQSKDYEFSRLQHDRPLAGGIQRRGPDAAPSGSAAASRPTAAGVATFDLPSTAANSRAAPAGRPEVGRRSPQESSNQERESMREAEVKARAFAMPLTSPAYPPGPYRFVNREFMIITYRTDLEKLRAVVPEPLEVDEPLVKYEFIRMPDSTGFGDYTETGQVIPVKFRGRKGGYTHCMFLNDEPPIAGGRELWGFPKKLANPTLHVEIDQMVGTLDYGPVRVATAHHGLQAQRADLDAVLASLAAPNFLLKIIPHVDGSPRICELVEYYLEDVDAQGRLDRAGGALAHPACARAGGRAAGAARWSRPCT